MTDDQRTPAILDLSDLAPVRPKIRLASGEYEVLSADDFGPVQAAKLSRLSNEAQKLQGDAEDAESAAILDANIRAQVQVLSPDMPQDVVGSLTFLQAVSIIDFFVDTSGLANGPPTQYRAMTQKWRERQQNGTS